MPRSSAQRVELALDLRRVRRLYVWSHLDRPVPRGLPRQLWWRAADRRPGDPRLRPRLDARVPMVNMQRPEAELTTFEGYVDGLPGPSRPPTWLTNSASSGVTTRWSRLRSMARPCVRLPYGTYQQAAVDGYISEFVGWLGLERTALGIQRAFRYATVAHPSCCRPGAVRPASQRASRPSRRHAARAFAPGARAIQADAPPEPFAPVSAGVSLFDAPGPGR